MKLPSAELAEVPRPKVVAYLLAPSHRFGRHKAGYFLRFGFTAPDWEILAAALKQHAATHEVAKVRENSFGTSYAVEGQLVCPDGAAAVGPHGLDRVARPNYAWICHRDSTTLQT